MRGQAPGRVKIWDSKSHREYHLETNCNHNYGANSHNCGAIPTLVELSSKFNFMAELILPFELREKGEGKDEGVCVRE